MSGQMYNVLVLVVTLTVVLTAFAACEEVDNELNDSDVELREIPIRNVTQLVRLFERLRDAVTDTPTYRTIKLSIVNVLGDCKCPRTVEEQVKDDYHTPKTFWELRASTKNNN